MIDVVIAARALLRARYTVMRPLLGVDLVPAESMDVLDEALRVMPDATAVARRADLVAAASIVGAAHPRLAERLLCAARWPL